MKFDCDTKRDARAKAKHEAWIATFREWRPFFAILPRRVAYGDCRFLETIERRRVKLPCIGFGYDYESWRWEYRAAPTKESP